MIIRKKYIFDAGGKKIDYEKLPRQEKLLAGLNISTYEDHIHPDYSREGTDRFDVLQKYGIDSTTLFDVLNYKLPNKEFMTGSLLVAAYHAAKLLDNDETDSPKALDHFITRFKAEELKKKAVTEVYRYDPNLEKKGTVLVYLKDLYFKYHSGIKISYEVRALFEYLDKCLKSLLKSDDRIKNLYKVFFARTRG